jgi:crotonobetainyl-CoA:carnitine CoA-transferase CaiB-like acyl-CoA transferase
MSAVNGALHGLKVIDLSRVLGGPYCTQALADHGAQVIKLEPPVGDETRTWGPPFDESDTAWYFNGVNRNKLGISVDLSCEDGRAILWQLLEDADVLVENFKPGTLARWGMDFERDLQPRFPRLIHCAVSGFGPDGPLGGLPGYDAAIQAMAGLMSVNGERDGGPMRVGLPIVDMVTGLNALAGILLALAEREKSGRGQSLDIAPYDSYQTGTAPIFLAVGNDRQFAKLCAHIGAPELPGDPRFAGNRSRCAHRPQLKQALEARLAQFECEPLARDLIHAGVPCGPVLSVDMVASHPHTLHRRMVVELGDYRGTGSPIKLSRTPATYRTPPPALGVDTDAVLASLGIDPDTRQRLFEAGVLKG